MPEEITTYMGCDYKIINHASGKVALFNDGFEWVRSSIPAHVIETAAKVEAAKAARKAAQGLAKRERERKRREVEREAERRAKTISEKPMTQIVYEVLSRAESPMTMTEIAFKAELPRSSVAKVFTNKNRVNARQVGKRLCQKAGRKVPTWELAA